MIKVALLVVFFLTVTLDELLDIGLLIVPGLSAKNAFLYVMLLAILCSKVIDRSRDGLQLPAIHLLFILLIADASLSIFYMHFVSGDTAGIGLFGHIAYLKGQLVDMYLMFLVFFYAVESRQAALNFAKFFLAVICCMALITLTDAVRIVNLDLISYYQGRLQGPLGGANSYGVFFAFFIPILVLAAMGVGNRFLRFVYLVGAAASFAVLIQTASRGGFVGMLGGAVLAAWWLHGSYDVRKAFRSAAAIVLLAAVTLTVVIATSEDLIEVAQQRIERTTEGTLDDRSAGRVFIWAQGLDYLMSRPWTLVVGAGWWTFWNRVNLSPHGAYVNLLFSLGIIGLGLFLALVHRVLTTARSAFSKTDDGEERLLIGGLVIGWLMLVVAMITGTFMPWMFIWPFTALCFRIAYCLESEAPARDTTSVNENELAPVMRMRGRPGV